MPEYLNAHAALIAAFALPLLGTVCTVCLCLIRAEWRKAGDK